MTTRGDLISEISQDMSRTSSSALAIISLKIGAAVRFYQNSRFWFNESESVTFNTVAGQTDYPFDGTTISTEFYKIDGVFIATANIDPVDLTYKRPVEFNALTLAEIDQAQPSLWTYYDKTLRLWAPPDQVYSIELMGHIKIAAPATDGEATNPWMNNAYDLIMCHTKAELYAHRWEDPTQAAVMAKAEQMWLNSLQSETADKFRTGSVDASQF